MTKFDEIKTWIAENCNAHRGVKGVKNFVKELAKIAAGDPDLLADAMAELVAAYRGKLTGAYTYDGAQVVKATDEEVITAMTYYIGFTRGFTYIEINAMLFDLQDYPEMPFSEIARLISQNNAEVIRWVNRLPYSVPEKTVILVSRGILERYAGIASNAELVRKAGAQETDEKALQELFDNDPSPAPPILPVGALPERIIRNA